jgi:hypothetical protein
MIPSNQNVTEGNAGGSRRRGEWLPLWVGELKDVRGILGMRSAIELAPVPGKDEELDRVAERALRTGKTA